MRVSVEFFQSYIQPNNLICGFYVNFYIYCNNKLAVIPICTTYQPDTLNLVELVVVQVIGAD